MKILSLKSLKLTMIIWGYFAILICDAHFLKSAIFYLDLSLDFLLNIKIFK